MLDNFHIGLHLWTLSLLGLNAPALCQKPVERSASDDTNTNYEALEGGVGVDATGVDICALESLCRLSVINKESRHPIQGAIVRVLCSDSLTGGWIPLSVQCPSAQGTTITDENGRADLPVPAGRELFVIATVDGPTESTRQMRLGPLCGNEERDVVMLLCSGVNQEYYLRVIDESTRAPIGGVRVFSAYQLTEEPVTVTDEDGLSVVYYVDCDGPLLRLSRDGYSSAFIETNTGHDHLGKTQQVGMCRTASIAVRVEKSTTSIGARCIIKARAPYGDSNSTHALVPHLDMQSPWKWESPVINGEALIEGLPAGRPIDLVCEWSSGSALEGPRLFPQYQRLVLRAGEVRAIETRPMRSKDIAGEVVDQFGDPCGGVELWLVPESAGSGATFRVPDAIGVLTRTHTDATGCFRIRNVWPGCWWLGIAPQLGEDPLWMAPTRLCSEEHAPGLDRAVRLIATKGASIRGKVLECDGQPVSHAIVDAVRGLDVITAVTDANGGFVMKPVGDQVYAISARATAEMLASAPMLVRNGITTIVCARGRQVNCLVMDIETGEGVRSGIVIENTPSGSSVATMETGMSDSEGYFASPAVARGCYCIRAFTADGRYGELSNVWVGEDEAANAITIPISVASTIRVDTLGIPDDDAIVVWCGNGFLQSWTPRSFRSRIIAVPPGLVGVERIDKASSLRHLWTVRLKVGEVGSILISQ